MNTARTLIMMAFLILLCSWGDKGHKKINGSTPISFLQGLTTLKDGHTNCLSMVQMQTIVKEVIPPKGSSITLILMLTRILLKTTILPKLKMRHSVNMGRSSS